MLLDLDHQAQLFQVGHDGLAGHKAVHAAVFFGCFVVDLGGQRQHRDHGQLVALAHLIVVLVMRRRHLHHAGAEFAVHVFVGDDGDLAAHQRQGHGLADQGAIALVFGVDHHGHVAQHGFGTGGCDHQIAFAAGQRVGDMPERTVFLLVFHFQVGDCRLQHRVPVHQALAAVDQALLVQLHKGLGHHLGQLVVHGEVLAAPVHGIAHAAHLGGDGVAGLFLPLPDLLGELVAAQVIAAHALGLQLTLHHDLGSDACVVGAGNPGRVVALHAVVACQRVHDGLVERVAHVQRTCHIGWGQLD